MAAIKGLKIGMLDFGYRSASYNSITVLQDVIDSCARAEELGYSHYWLSEHHESSNKAWFNPEMLLPVLLSTNQSINIGAAGIMLRCHSPYRVAMNFKLLETLFPGRVDLGMAHGKVSATTIENLMVPGEMSTKENAEKLVAFLNGKNADGTRVRQPVPPVNHYIPRLWRLSKSFANLHECLQHKMNYCVSVFHEEFDMETARTQLKAFRETNQSGFVPRINLCFAGIITEKKEEAEKIIRARKMIGTNIVNMYMIGTIEDFKDVVHSYHEAFGITEFTFLDTDPLKINRSKTMEWIAKAFL